MRVYSWFLGLVTLIQSLTQRSGRADWRLPLLCLVTTPETRSPLAVLEGLLAVGDRRVPYVRVAADDGDLRRVLYQACEGLSGGSFGGAPLRFRHYLLVDWLMRVDLTSVPVDKRQRELARQLRRNLGLLPHRDNSGAGQALGGWPGLALWLAAIVLPSALLRVLVTGRLFGLGREFRWLMRQQYLAPRLSGTFLAFARRLTVGARESEVSAQIDRLLVHAFLQDLRVAYRRRPWRLAGWRRTAYPVLLLDNVAPSNAGYPLLGQVNAVRNETGRSDPLLVIASGAQVPPDGLDASDPATIGALMPLDGVAGAYRAWHGSVPSARRAREPAAWYLPVSIPEADLTAFQPRLPGIVAGPVPWLARPLVLIGLVLAVLLGAGAWYGPDVVGTMRAWQAGCYHVAPDGRVRTVLADDQQCLGYSDSVDQHFSQDAGLIAIQDQIFALNRKVVDASQVKRQNPYITLVYLASFTKPGGTLRSEETFAAEREELQGMYAAQLRAYDNAMGSTDSPLLRIMVANAGQEMGHAQQVVGMLTDLARTDRSVAGVLGLVESRSGTKQAISALNQANLPVVVPTLSADGIAGAASNYLQLSAPNVDEANFVFDYATRTLHRTTIWNFYTYGTSGLAAEDNDLYVNTLKTDLRNKFGVANYKDTFWTANTDLSLACEDSFNGVVFFGGRYSEFGAFADHLARTCNGRAVLIADDSINRYMANIEARRRAPANLPVAYVSKGALSYCDRLVNATDDERSFFRRDVAEMGLCGTGKAVGERVGLAYDATRLFLRAISEAYPGGPGQVWNPAALNPNTVLAQLKRPGGRDYYGVTGLIRFDQNGVALGKRLTLLCAHSIPQAFNTDNEAPFEVDRTPSHDPGKEERIYGERPVVPRACT